MPPVSAPEPARTQSAVANVEHTKRDLKNILDALTRFRAEHPGSCPRFVDLQAGAFLDPFALAVDDWGSAFQIACSPEESRVSSMGPDRKLGDEDDLWTSAPTSPPSPPRDPHSSGTVPVESPETVMASLAQGRLGAQTRRCYEPELAKNSDFRADFGLDATIRKDGKIDVVVTRPGTSPTLLQCVVNALRGTTLPAEPNREARAVGISVHVGN